MRSKRRRKERPRVSTPDKGTRHHSAGTRGSGTCSTLYSAPVREQSRDTRKHQARHERVNGAGPRSSVIIPDLRERERYGQKSAYPHMPAPRNIAYVNILCSGCNVRATSMPAGERASERQRPARPSFSSMFRSQAQPPRVGRRSVAHSGQARRWRQDQSPA
jgi:5-methylcytosine-specific restriction endonuclease McrA